MNRPCTTYNSRIHFVILSSTWNDLYICGSQGCSIHFYFFKLSPNVHTYIPTPRRDSISYSMSYILYQRRRYYYIDPASRVDCSFSAARASLRMSPHFIAFRSKMHSQVSDLKCFGNISQRTERPESTYICKYVCSVGFNLITRGQVQEQGRSETLRLDKNIPHQIWPIGLVSFAILGKISLG
jgi:hypothetical protein